MSEANDRAFIKISEELIRLRNDVLLLTMLDTIYQSLGTYTRSSIQGFKTNGLHSEELQGGSNIIDLLSAPDKLTKKQDKIKARLHELEELAALYIKGSDIVAAKLSR